MVATYTKDETGMDLVIRLPVSYPLRPVDVNCTKSIGISDAKQRKWLMSMLMFVRNQVRIVLHNTVAVKVGTYIQAQI